jgi:catechol 1,2-dioxygenase
VSSAQRFFKLPSPHLHTELPVRLVDEITFKLAGEAHDTATASAILGPFFRHDAPELPNESNIVHGVDDGEMTYMYGHVRDAKTGKPVVNATVDVWEASTNGLYEQQDDNQVDCNLRGKFRTDENGRYAYYCLRPTPYPVPNDGQSSSVFKNGNMA